jgi:hypothetical protein
VIAAAAIAALLAAAPAGAETSYGVQLLLGVPFNVPTPLTIRQRGEPDLHVTARYATHPFSLPLYLGVGVFRREGGHEWSLELIHHKLYLENPPPEVGSFSISHGYNLVVLSHGFEVSSGVWARAGGGLVVAHPESTVRDETWPQNGGPFGLGFRFAGALLSAGVEGRIPLGDRLRLAIGGRLTGAYASVPVVNGTAIVPNVAFHATAGLDGDVLRSSRQ